MRMTSRRKLYAAAAACAVVAATVIAAPASAKPSLPDPDLTSANLAQLHSWFNRTYSGMKAMTPASGLVADNLCQDPATGTWTQAAYTSPTDIGAYLWSTIAAQRLGAISTAQETRRVQATLTSLAGMQRSHGFWFQWYNPVTGAVLTTFPADGTQVRPFLSTVDNAWLAVGLHLVKNTMPQLAPQADGLLSGMDFSFFYDVFVPTDPFNHPGQMFGGYYTDTNSYTSFHYGSLDTEPRMASYLGMAEGTVPTDHYWRMYRTLPPDWTWQKQIPTGPTVNYDGVNVFEGSYQYRGTQLVPSWGGSMFEELMVPLFVPESQWAPNSWGKNHPLYVNAQIQHGTLDTDYGYWGFSPSNKPEGGYQAFGVAQIGMSADGYPSNEDNTVWTRTNTPAPSAYTNGIATPHASFLALPYAGAAAMANLNGMKNAFPGLYGEYGFQDSVNLQTGVASKCVLSLDQGMSAAAMANALTGNYLQTSFADQRFTSVIQPLIAKETFNDKP
jgi:hypothetical protein